MQHSENEQSPYFYQWDTLGQSFQRPPIPPTPSPPRRHIRMASMDLSDSYSLNSSRTESSSTSTNISDISVPNSNLTPSDDYPPEISDFYERRKSIVRNFPPLPPVPIVPRDEGLKQTISPIREDSLISTIASTTSNLKLNLKLINNSDDTSNDTDNSNEMDSFDWSRPQYMHLKTRECPSTVSCALFLISLLAVPFALCIYLGWLDRSVGVISMKWKIANLVSFCIMTLGGIVGICAGLGVGLSS